MRVLILTDVHANLEALESVLADAAGQYDEIWNLGDTVGYGPNPVECIDRLNDVAKIQLSGNHDLACAGTVSTDDFNPVAKSAAEWTSDRLTSEQKAMLSSRPSRIDLDDVNQMTGAELPKDTSDTLGGFIYSQLGRVPINGEEVEAGSLHLVVEEVVGRRIRKVRASTRGS